MIRSVHKIDTELVNHFISENNFDLEINESLLRWYHSLGDKDHQNSRDSAISFLRVLSMKVLTEIDYPVKERENLIKIFDPLELLLRTALSIKQPSEDEHYVRDHLSHTVRNVLFTNFLLKKYAPANFSSKNMQLFITAIFHDIAYPIEKIKKVAKKLGGSTFTDLLNSKGDVEISLNRPNDLLEMLDYFGLNIKDLEKKVGHDKDHESYQTLVKLKHVYREVISTAIAGKGLFDASHAISSVVLFVKPIIKFWQNSKAYHDINFESVIDICLAMAYHDRQFLIQNIEGFDLPVILKIMRLADELQEWDRESDSFIEDASIIHDLSSILTFNLNMRHKSKGTKMLCKAEYVIPDKLNGILPIVGQDEKIKLIINFPDEVDLSALKTRLHEKVDEPFGKSLKYRFAVMKPGRHVELVFKTGNALITISE